MRRFVSLILLLLVPFCLFTQDILPNKIRFKVNLEERSNCHANKITISSLDNLLQSLGDYYLVFPQHRQIAKNNTHSSYDLSTIYELNLKHNGQELKASLLLQNHPAIVYAEPVYQDYLCYQSNDTLNHRQYYLATVKAFDAWDIEKGDSSVVIAITDTGSDIDHPDLINEWLLNEDDTIDGLDNDQDGYIDNYYGWNTASNNNDVSFGVSGHGTNVAGIAGASTDNVFGISGIGFKTKLLTVRIDLPNGVLSGAYQGLVYAADQGAQIINASWGSNSFSQFAQDVVRYVTKEKGALIIAGAGNFGNDVPFYPAAYPEVIGVGATIEGDTVKSSSNFGHWTDVFAPGENMFTTNAAGGFGINGGTSMASPVVAGAAALIKSHFPQYGPEAIREKIINSCDPIDQFSPAQYAGKLGNGRLNIYRALTENNLPGLYFIPDNLSDASKTYSVGDTVQVIGTLVNYLENANNINLQFNENSNALSWINNNYSINNLAAGDSVKIQGQISFIVNSGVNINQNIEIALSTSADNNYQRNQYFPISINRDYITIKTNKLSATYTSSGSIGYTGNFNNLGDGISYQSGSSLLYEGSLMIGNSSQYMLDQFRNKQGGVDQDFQRLVRVRTRSPKVSNVEIDSRYTDGNFANPQNLSIHEESYLFNSGGIFGDQSIIKVYTLQNNGILDLNQLYLGIIMDWDIVNYLKNQIIYDSTRQMGISYSTDSNLYCGIKLLSPQYGCHHYALDNVPGIDPIIDPSSGLSAQDKLNVLSLSRDSAGFSNIGGNDIIDAISAGPFNLKKDSVVSIGFLIVVAESIASLQNEADSMQKQFDQLSLGVVENKIINPFSLQSNIFPNPAKDKLNVKFSLPYASSIKINIYDAVGKSLKAIEKTDYNKGEHILEIPIENLKSGLYFLQIEGANFKIENIFAVSNY